MTIPTRPAVSLPEIESATIISGMYQVILADDTILWIPDESSNSDHQQLVSWAQENQVEL